MDSVIRTELWKQFGAAIDMFENALKKCPESLWAGEEKFWYNGYHCLFYLDYYLSEEPDKFQPPPPYTLSKFDPAGVLPERVYTKAELLEYLEHCREKCRKLIAGLTPETMAKRWKNEYKDYSMYEILLYNMRHIQHHTGQLNMLLGKIDHDLPVWVSQTKINLQRE